MTKEVIAGYFSKLHEVLQGDVSRVAPILRQLTGPVAITPTGRKMGNRHVWQAQFTANLLPVLVEIGRANELPNRDTLEFLKQRGWKFEKGVTVEIDKPPRYEQLADEFRRMAADGLSVSAMAFRKDMNWVDADDCLNFALCGKLPCKRKQAKKKRNGGAIPRDLDRAKRLAPEVLKRRPINGHGDSFPKIAKDLGITEHLAKRAYDEGLRLAGIDPLGPDGKFDRGLFRKVSTEQIQAVHRHLKEGKLSVKQIAEKTGVIQSTIRREMRKGHAA